MNKKHQTGFSMVSTLLTVSAIGFLALFAVRLVPIYMEHSGVSDALRLLSEYQADDDEYVDRHVLRKELESQFTINNVTSVQRDDITFETDLQEIRVQVKYSAQITLFRNIDLVVHFTDGAIVKKNDS